MDCLYCGDCCLRMSPLASENEPCPRVIKMETPADKNPYYFCRNFLARPNQCRKHSFPARFCPIGMEKLRLSHIDDIRFRIDQGYTLILRELKK